MTETPKDTPPEDSRHTDVTSESPELSQNFLSLILENIPDMIFVKDEAFRIIQANSNFLNVYPENMRGNVIGTTTLEQYDDVEREAFLTEDRRAFAEGMSEVEESIQFPDGERRLLQTRKVKFSNSDGEAFILGIGQDITEITEIRKERERAFSLLETVLDTTTGAIVGLNVDKDIITINSAGRKLLGITETETPFSWPQDIVFLDPTDMQPLESSQDPVARALIGHSIKGEVHLMNRKGDTEQRYVRVTSSPTEGEDSPLKSVIVLDDVSEAENNRQRLERQSRLDALGQLTGGIAHDFNNLLNTMLFAVELIRRDNLSERGERSAKAALSSVKRGSELTARLLAFAKKQPARAIARPISDLFAELKQLISPGIEASLNIYFETEEDNLLVYCDQGQLENAVLNLVLNSRDAIIRGSKGNRITIAARSIDHLPVEIDLPSQQIGIYTTAGSRSSQQDALDRADGTLQRYVEISVSDDGPGMSDAVKSRAVDPFFTTKDANSGTGLGLSMVYGFVQQADGELRIYSEEDKGTTIRLFLPRGDAVEGLETPTLAAPLIEGRGEAILIVEDEVFLLEQMNELLQELKYKTILAHSGQEALSMIETGVKADLILTDIVMPGGVGGFELARKARDIMADIPIIYMSGYTGYSEEEMGDVIAPLLPKPSSPATLTAEIRAAIDARKS